MEEYNRGSGSMPLAGFRNTKSVQNIVYQQTGRSVSNSRQNFPASSAKKAMLLQCQLLWLISPKTKRILFFWVNIGLDVIFFRIGIFIFSFTLNYAAEKSANRLSTTIIA
jgi:hypothetical protein